MKSFKLQKSVRTIKKIKCSLITANTTLKFFTGGDGAVDIVMQGRIQVVTGVIIVTPP